MPIRRSDVEGSVKLLILNTAIYLTLEDQGDNDTLQRDLDRLQDPNQHTIYTSWAGPGGCQQRHVLGVGYLQ